jgi:hypothetical protein
MKKPTRQVNRREMSSKSARISRGDLMRLEAFWIDKTKENNVHIQLWQAGTAKIEARLVSAVTQGPAIVLKSGIAKGSIGRRKGGVIPGGRVFI